MLQAKDKNGKMISLVSLSRKEIANVKKHHSFFCPVCEERVLMKAGLKNIPHFAHLSDSTCPTNHRGEGEYHMKGKRRLYEWLKKENQDVRLEVYLRTIQQRPDILVQYRQENIVIEFQCARISKEEIIKRQKGYQKLGITPIWILGAKLLKRIGKNHLKLDPFTRHFIHQFNPSLPPTLYYFCPHTATLSFVTDIHMTSTTRALVKYNKVPLKNLSFSKLFPDISFTKHELLYLWKREKRYFRIRPRHRLSRTELNWHHWLYHHETHFEHLPSIIYLPVYSSYLMQTPLENWQSRLYLQLIHPLPIGEIFSWKECVYLLRYHTHDFSSYPTITTPKHPIQQYLHILIKLHILEKVSTNTYRKLKQVKMYSHLEEALKGDELFLNHLIDMSQNA